MAPLLLAVLNDLDQGTEQTGICSNILLYQLQDYQAYIVMSVIIIIPSCTGYTQTIQILF